MAFGIVAEGAIELAATGDFPQHSAAGSELEFFRQPGGGELFKLLTGHSLQRNGPGIVYGQQPGFCLQRFSIIQFFQSPGEDLFPFTADDAIKLTVIKDALAVGAGFRTAGEKHDIGLQPAEGPGQREQFNAIPEVEGKADNLGLCLQQF